MNAQQSEIRFDGLTPRKVRIPADWTTEWSAFGLKEGPEKPLSATMRDESGREYRLDVGGFHVMSRANAASSPPRNPVVTIEHASVLFALLTKTDEIAEQPPVSWSYRQLFVRMGMPADPNYRRTDYLKSIIEEVADLWYRKQYLDSDTWEAHRVFSRFSFGNRHFVGSPHDDGRVVPMNHTLAGVQFDPEFLRALWPGIDSTDRLHRKQTRAIDYTAFASISDMRARQLYVTLGTWAALRTKEKTYHRDTTPLVDCLGWTPPTQRYRLRDISRIFLGRPGAKSSIISELDGKPLLNGVLRVTCRKNNAYESQSGNPANWDFVIDAWCEGRVDKEGGLVNFAAPASDGKLLRATRLPAAEFYSLCRSAPELTDEDFEALAKAQYGEPAAFVPFLRYAKMLLGRATFIDTVLETRDFAVNGGKFTTNAGAKVNYDLIAMVETRAGQGAFSPSNWPSILSTAGVAR